MAIYYYRPPKYRHRLLMSIHFRRLCIIVLVFGIAACAAPNRRVIKNDALDHFDYDRMHYVNLFPPQYGYLEESEYDKIDYLQPHERKPHKYRILSDPRGDIDRTLGYDPLDYTVTPDFSLIHEPAHDVQITWIRHASFLIQLGGKYQILVDPVMAPLDGLVGKFGKYSAIGTLYAETPLTIQDLPFNSDVAEDGKINIVAISHNHYDHLNWNTINQLPESTHFYVPLRLENYVPARFPSVTGMDWYTQDTFGDLSIYFLPANHRSGRSLHAAPRILWGGWLFEWNHHRVYFAGDTGYSAVFKDMRQRYGEFDVCLMPISAYFQRHWHFAPEDAIEAAEDLGCKALIPWGWGTWINSFEHILEPPRRLQYAWDKTQPENMSLHILKMGETFTE